MYVTSARSRLPIAFDVPYVLSGTGYRFAEETFSWRTGRAARDSVFSDHTIQPPSVASGHLGERIRARTKYINEISQNMASQSSAPFQVQDRFLTHDTGHSFWNIKYTRSGTGRNDNTYSGQSPDRPSTGSIFLTGAIAPVQIVPKTFNAIGRTWDGNRTCGPSSAELDASSSALFNSARPDGSIAGWGETVVELASGNLPKVVTKLGRDIASGKFLYKSLKENASNVSSDYLNGLFGWSPIIRDFMSTVEHLLSIHDFLYSSSYRRRRSVPPKSFSAPTKYYPSLGNPSIVKGEPSIAMSLNSPLIKADSGLYTYTYDTRLSARFTRARPSAAANAFADKGLEILQTFGVLSPSLSWDIIPYSFLVDWCFHLGSGIENYSTYSLKSGSFKTDYAYATTRSIATSFFPAGRGYRDWGRRIETSSWTSLHESTVCTFRQQATPFGFGLSLPQLSGAQYAILVALGLARSR